MSMMGNKPLRITLRAQGSAVGAVMAAKIGSAYHFGRWELLLDPVHPHRSRHVLVSVIDHDENPIGLRDGPANELEMSQVEGPELAKDDCSFEAAHTVSTWTESWSRSDCKSPFSTWRHWHEPRKHRERKSTYTIAVRSSRLTT